MQCVQSIHYLLLSCKEGKAETERGFQQGALYADRFQRFRGTGMFCSTGASCRNTYSLILQCV